MLGSITQYLDKNNLFLMCMSLNMNHQVELQFRVVQGFSEWVGWVFIYNSVSRINCI